AFGPPNQYVGSMMHGTLQIVRVPSGDQLDKYSAQVIKNNGFDERDQVREKGSGGGVSPRRVGEPWPIKHVIYVVKENRRSDQYYQGAFPLGSPGWRRRVFPELWLLDRLWVGPTRSRRLAHVSESRDPYGSKLSGIQPVLG